MVCKSVFLIPLGSAYIRPLHVWTFPFLTIGSKMACLFDWIPVCCSIHRAKKLGGHLLRHIPHIGGVTVSKAPCSVQVTDLLLLPLYYL